MCNTLPCKRWLQLLCDSGSYKTCVVWMMSGSVGGDDLHVLKTVLDDRPQNLLKIVLEHPCFQDYKK